MKIVWKTKINQYGPSTEQATINGLTVGSVYYSGTVGRGDPLKYEAYCSLPGAKKQPRFATEEEAKQKIEEIVSLWFAMVLKEYT